MAERSGLACQVGGDASVNPYQFIDSIAQSTNGHVHTQPLNLDVRCAVERISVDSDVNIPAGVWIRSIRLPADVEQTVLAQFEAAMRRAGLDDLTATRILNLMAPLNIVEGIDHDQRQELEQAIFAEQGTTNG